MATERLTMRDLREILRQKLQLRRSHRKTARAIGISAGSVASAAIRAKALGLDWEAVEKLDDEQLETRMYGPRGGKREGRPEPDLPYLHLELRRPGVTLQLLHLEYLEQHADGYRYTAFCHRYAEWVRKQRISMRQTHLAGDKMFVDYSGKKPHIVDPVTGEVIDVELFVAVLGASSCTFAEASYTQQLPDWIASNTRALAFFGGVPNAVVPDQLKSAVTLACKYEPGVQKTFDEWARHYETTILPARPRKPRDKAKVEVAVQVAQRWILARLRNQTFFSLAELNARIAELCAELNERQMRTYKASRRELFERLDRPALRPLPASSYEYAQWKRVTLGVDYHVAFEGHFYSAPHELRGEELWLRATAATIEIFRHGRREAAHARSRAQGRHTTVTAHMPVAHQRHAEWTPERILGWAASVGVNTRQFAERLLSERSHPEHGYRSCLGVFRLSKKYGSERLDAACARALSVGALSYRHVASILQHGLDRAPALDIEPRGPGATHENVRGREYYH
ncbi:MAG TPA: IS21 family transposase [Polyangiaceae bacterium]